MFLFKFKVLRAKVPELFKTLNFKRDIQKKYDRNRKIKNKTLLKKIRAKTKIVGICGFPQ